jgi:XRE family transcriptional regulator, fatty acid utilization regulator
MSEQKLFAGHAVRRIRRANGLTQAVMAEALAVSPSYLNLIERNQRPLTASLLLRLAERYDFDPRTLTGATPGGGVEAIRRRLGDPMFADLNVDRAQVEEWIAASPDAAEAFARLFDRISGGSTGSSPATIEPEAIASARREIERWRNHFADLDAQAEALADELRLSNADLYAAITERLRMKHQLSIRILPFDVMPGHLRRLDLHARQLQLSELLDPASRTFAAAYQLATIEAKPEIEALVAGGGFTERAGERLYRRHLISYFAAAVMMPYARFLRACEATGYDIVLLQRVGQRGLPFFMLRIDRAGQSSKRYAGASASPLVETERRCPLWQVHHVFARPGTLVPHLVELEDGSRWFTLSRTVNPQLAVSGGVQAEFAICLGLDAKLAAPLAAARGIDLTTGAATPVGLGCPACTRPECPQRSAPPAGRVLVFNERERGMSPFAFDRD